MKKFPILTRDEAARLKAKAEEVGSQQELADAWEVDDSYLSRLAHRKHGPSYRVHEILVAHQIILKTRAAKA